MIKPQVIMDLRICLMVIGSYLENLYDNFLAQNEDTPKKKHPPSM